MFMNINILGNIYTIYKNYDNFKTVHQNRLYKNISFYLTNQNKQQNKTESKTLFVNLMSYKVTKNYFKKYYLNKKNQIKQKKKEKKKRKKEPIWYRE